MKVLLITIQLAELDERRLLVPQRLCIILRGLFQYFFIERFCAFGLFAGERLGLFELLFERGSHGGGLTVQRDA